MVRKLLVLLILVVVKISHAQEIYKKMLLPLILNGHFVKTLGGIIVVKSGADINPDISLGREIH